MDYKQLNDQNRRRMLNTIRSDYQMEWSDNQILDILSGKLPKVRHYTKEDGIEKEVYYIQQAIQNYDYFNCNHNEFINNLKKQIEIIRDNKPFWNGININEVEECISQQKFCLISGEGGIGKSYFIQCLEDRLTQLSIEHLCIYGKFEKDIDRIDIEQIISIAVEKGFVFIVDAINEMNLHGQNRLLEVIKNVKDTQRLRIIITYRTHTMDPFLLNEFNKMACASYTFPGISFESAIDCLNRRSVQDSCKYENILYSNNALQINMLCSLLEESKLKDEQLNSIASITFILENYIKENVGKNNWEATKKVAAWMYDNNSRNIDENNLASCVPNAVDFIKEMEQFGFIGEYERNGTVELFFLIDSLTDYLIARSMFRDIKEKDFEKHKNLINEKLYAMPSLGEAIILLLFDRFPSDYKYVAELIFQTDLVNSFNYDIILKLIFKPEGIESFKSTFQISDTSKLLLYFGGYTNKPYNCCTYLNEYYLNDSHRQLSELTNVLSGRYIVGHLNERLKNISYCLSVDNFTTEKLDEIFYVSLWCSAAPNKDIRCLALKSLYECVRKDNRFINLIIELFERIEDYYIRDAIVYVLTTIGDSSESTVIFMQSLKNDKSFFYSKSIRRIAEFFGEKYQYILWNKENIFLEFVQAEPFSEEFNKLLMHIDILEKELMPFRYWGRDHIDLYTKFLIVDKQYVLDYNNLLKKCYNCIDGGECSGTGFLEDFFAEKYKKHFKDKTMSMNSYIACLEKLVNTISSLYGINVYDKQQSPYDEPSFYNSALRKCIIIAVDLLYGSMMCNYYTNQFASYNSFQETIGYEVYDPLEYGEEFSLASPVPTYQSDVEQMGDIVLKSIVIPDIVDSSWLKNVDLTRANISSLSKVITYHNRDWIMIAGRINLQGNNLNKWRDTYDWWCCTNPEITIENDGNARYLTIELEKYSGNMFDYKNTRYKPYLCKGVSPIAAELFDETSLTLPPAEIIRYFNLRLDEKNMTWLDDNGESVIICNNNKNSYYRDSIGATVFMRKDLYDNYAQNENIKFFAFSERYIEPAGFSEETSIHFEINKEGEIKKEIMNYDRTSAENHKKTECQKCVIHHEMELFIRKRCLNSDENLIEQLMKNDVPDR